MTGLVGLCGKVRVEKGGVGGKRAKPALAEGKKGVVGIFKQSKKIKKDSIPKNIAICWGRRGMNPFYCVFLMKAKKTTFYLPQGPLFKWGRVKKPLPLECGWAFLSCKNPWSPLSRDLARLSF